MLLKLEWRLAITVNFMLDLSGLNLLVVVSKVSFINHVDPLPNPGDILIISASKKY